MNVNASVNSEFTQQKYAASLLHWVITVLSLQKVTSENSAIVRWVTEIEEKIVGQWVPSPPEKDNGPIYSTWSGTAAQSYPVYTIKQTSSKHRAGLTEPRHLAQT